MQRAVDLARLAHFITSEEIEIMTVNGMWAAHESQAAMVRRSGKLHRLRSQAASLLTLASLVCLLPLISFAHCHGKVKV